MNWHLTSWSSFDYKMPKTLKNHKVLRSQVLYRDAKDALSSLYPLNLSQTLWTLFWSSRLCRQTLGVSCHFLSAWKLSFEITLTAFLLGECLMCLFQLWRPVTATLYFPITPNTGFLYLVNLYFLYHYSTRLETGEATDWTCECSVKCSGWW